MKRSNSIWTVLAFLLIGITVFSGCSSSNSSTSPETPINVTGTWTIVATGYTPMTAVLNHVGTTITGTVSDTDNASVSISGTSESAANTTGSRNVTLTIQFVSAIGSITMTGAANDENTSMSGSYVDNSGGHGTWTATIQ